MWWFIAGAALVLAGVVIRSALFSFHGQRPLDYRSNGKDITLSDHLKDEMSCHGVLYGPFGKVVSRFIADMSISWDGKTGRMDELFRYDSGNTQTRIWEMELQEDGGLIATASDFEGKAIGKISGSTIQLKYRYRLPKESGGHVLNVVDWMYLLEDGTLVNRSQFRKFGIKVAELVATIQPKAGHA